MKKWIFSQKVFSLLSSDSFDNNNEKEEEEEEEWISSRTRCNKKSGKASTR